MLIRAAGMDSSERLTTILTSYSEQQPRAVAMAHFWLLFPLPTIPSCLLANRVGSLLFTAMDLPAVACPVVGPYIHTYRLAN